MNLDSFLRINVDNSLLAMEETILFVKPVFITEEGHHLHKRMKQSKSEVNQR